MTNNRMNTILSLIKGLLSAVALTVALMAILATLAVRMRLQDHALTILNQVLKVMSILLGVLVAVGRGGRRGFMTGMTVAGLYMALGYCCYAALGGNAFAAGEMLGEILIGAAVGGVAGAVLANWPEKRRAA